jgi:xanthine dehydrogenase iron-sulfur cluster and FAD-binding subunit A
MPCASRLGITSPKKGCDHAARTSASRSPWRTQGAEIVTAEGLAGDGNLHPLLRSFIEHDAFQCGYCTPGQIVSAVGMLREADAGWPSAVSGDGDRGGYRARRGGDPGAHERQPLPLRGLREHRPGHRSGCAPVKPFRYVHADDVSGAVATLAEAPDGAFLAGGTKLVDLMKLEMATPDVLVDSRT